MKRKTKYFFRLLPASLVILLLIHTHLYGQPTEQEQKTDAAKEPSAISILTDNKSDDDFEYTIEDRGDPFLPFLVEEKKPDANMDDIVDIEGELTGMQLFEPGQLTLVAIAQSTLKHFAMVQDFTGKGYIITKGIKIGKRGVITDIVPNQVIIEETAYTRAGKKLIKEIIMYLKQEGEE